MRSKFFTTIGACVLTAVPMFAVDNKKNEDVKDRLDEAATVLSEVMAAPDKGIPSDLMSNAHCIVIVPGLKKGAFIVGGEFGKGFMSCRAAGGWSAPGAIRMEGGSFGFQIGGSETDVVLLVMNDRGADRLLSSQFTLGADAAVAAGPVGRQSTAQTDGKFTAEILSWSRSRGAFAGIALKGATLRQDEHANAALYGHEMKNKEIVDTHVAWPSAAAKFSSVLSSYSAAEKK